MPRPELATLLDQPGSLVDLLNQRAAVPANDPALIFLSDSGAERATLTYRELKNRAHAFACQLACKAAPGERAILIFPTGPEFVIAFFACALAGIIAVPIMQPRRLALRDSSESIFNDCAPRLVLTTVAIKDSARANRLRQQNIHWLCVDGLSGESSGALPVPSGNDLVLLQYTSGSTSDPKGVMVTHGNIITNLKAIAHAFGNFSESTYVSWGPLYHDMGLIMDLLQPIYLGAPGILMQPNAFMQRPMTWLRAIHHYGAEVAGAPNFAFDLCVERFRPEQMDGIDLSKWKVAFNGAEPVRAKTLDRFAETFAPYGFNANSFYPCYGLAEATLMVAGGKRGEGAFTHNVSHAALQRNRIAASVNDIDSFPVVASGRAVTGTTIAIVEPNSCTRLPNLEIGEIWIAGPSISLGYWQNEPATTETFRARILNEEGYWLRTGDLGFLDRGGILTVTGRIKDVLLVRGSNHYPQDIEETVRLSHPALSAQGAVFMPDAEGDQIIVAHEVARSHRHQLPFGQVVDSIREAIARQHGLSVQEVVLLQVGALPKTTSGKVRRRATADLWQRSALDRLK